MNDERSLVEEEATVNFTDSQTESEQPTELIAASKIIDQGNDNNQLTLLHQPVWFWELHSSWSHFIRGLFWGGIIASTAMFSAGLGVALTRIAVVEEAIAQTIDSKTSKRIPEAEVTLESQASLTRPVNILLIEVQSDPDDLIVFDRDFVGKTKTILLLKFNPQLGLAEAINIPTDSRVKIPGRGWGTISDAHAYGGTALVSRMVNQLLDGVGVDRYVRATTQTWQQLSDSGKLTLAGCNERIQDCGDKTDQIIRQENTFKAIRQHLSIPAYVNNFQTAASKIKPQLDSNISVPEIMSIVNFVQKLESDKITVNLLPGYTPGKTLAKQKNENSLSLGLSNNYTRFSDRVRPLPNQSTINKGMQTSHKPKHWQPRFYN